MKDLIFNAFLIVHCIGGGLGLITGTSILFAPKGLKLHRKLGWVFITGMALAGISSLVLAYLHPSSFLFMIGVFTLYLVGTGYRFIHTKSAFHAPNLFDRLLQAGMGISGITLVYSGVRIIFDPNLFGLVFLVFGGIGLTMLTQDIQRGHTPTTSSRGYIPKHLQRLLGAFIASLTAFLVVNLSYLPDFIPSWIYWILPTLSITPLIILWTRRYPISVS